MLASTSAAWWLPTPIIQLTPEICEAIKAGVVDGLLAADNDKSPHDPGLFGGVNRWAKIVRGVHPRLIALGFSRSNCLGQPRFISPDGRLRLVFCSGVRIDNYISGSAKGVASLSLVTDNLALKNGTILGPQLSLFPEMQPVPSSVFVAHHRYRPPGANPDSDELWFKLTFASPTDHENDMAKLLIDPGDVRDYCDEQWAVGISVAEPQEAAIEVIITEVASG